MNIASMKIAKDSMSDMKTLIIVGSPKKNGQTMKLVDRFMKNICGDREILNVFDYQPIKPCLDCGHCKIHSTCKQIDGFNEIIKKIKEADCIVLASPMWFGNISGPLMSFMSRIHVLSNAYEQRKDSVHQWDKVGILLMTTGAKWYSMSKSVEASVEFLFAQMDALMLDWVYANKTDVLSTEKNRQAMMKCDHAAAMVKDWYKDKRSGNYIQYGYSSMNNISFESNLMLSEDKGE